jgi:hypothetical protein
MQLNFNPTSPEVWGNLDILRNLNKKFVSINYRAPSDQCFTGDESSGRKIPGKMVEVTLVNRRSIKLNSESRSSEIHKLNTNSCPMAL